ncbi:MAG: YfhO family protein [Clostridia bacterium]|nr:YfhO family protein [Clostridia bacterium]
MKLNDVQNRCRAFFAREKYAVASFGMTYTMLLIFAIVCELAPFGRYSLLAIDLHGQYYPMMTEKLSDLFSVWSWNGSLGFSTLAQGAYYTNSIFILLLALFSEYARIAILDLVIFLKIALSAAFFSYYLEQKHKKYSLFITVFGIAYALSAYMTAFIAQPMWLDVVLLLPLILNGLERMLQGKNPLRYTLLLAFAIFSNFYISFMLCIFLVLWFVILLIAEKRRSLRETVRMTGKFAIFSLLAGMLCAAVILPLLANMENWISSSLSFSGEIEWYHRAAEIADAFSFGAKSSREFGAANVFCGSSAVFFLLLFLFNSGIPLKKRLSYTALTVFLFLSFEINLLDYIWHGFHFPNQLPARQSFLLIFLLLMIAYETLLHRKELDFVRLFVSYLISAGVLFIGLSESANTVGRIISVMILTLVFLLMVLSLCLRDKKDLRNVCATLLAFVLMTESIVNGMFVLCFYTGVTDAVKYVENEADMEYLSEKYESGKTDFYRSEVYPNFTFNTGQLYQIKGVTYYSSTMNGQLYRLFERLGNRVYAQNVSTVYQPTPMQDMMFGVRYHYMRSGKKLDYGKRIEKTETVSVYESPYALPLAYTVDPDIKRFMTVSVEDPTVYEGIALQARFLSLAAGFPMETLASETAASDVRVSNGTINGKYLHVKDTDSEAIYSAEFQAEHDGYFYLDFDFKIGTYTAFINGKNKHTGSCGSDTLLSLGYVQKGDTVSVEVSAGGYQTVLYGVKGWVLNEDALMAVHETLSEGGLCVTFASDTKIRGTVSVSEDAVLYSSIPAETGWAVYIDGEKQETYDLDSGLLCCDITAGEHTVEYRYSPPGFVLGMGITLAAAGILFLYVYTKKRAVPAFLYKELLKSTSPFCLIQIRKNFKKASNFRRALPALSFSRKFENGDLQKRDESEYGNDRCQNDDRDDDCFFDFDLFISETA